MRRKLKARKGFTLVELLVALMILALLTVAVATGTQAGAKIHQDARFASESALLAESLGNALGDILRYAVPVEPEGGGDVTAFKNESYAYLGECWIEADENGRLVLSGGSALPLLGEGTYTNMAVTDFELIYENGLFTGSYTIESTWGNPPFTKEITFAFRSLDG